MKILILTVGKPKDKRIASLAEEYLARIRPGLVEVDSVTDRPVSSLVERIEREGQEILQKLRPRDRLILLSEDGQEYGSKAFAALLSREMETAQGRVVLAIGGPWGASEALRKRADLLLSLSQMTFPHELCFLFLAEQLYRAFSILQGAKYHH